MNKLLVLTANGKNASTFLISKIQEWKENNNNGIAFRFPEICFNFNSLVPLAESEFEALANSIFQALDLADVCICTHSHLLFTYLRIQIAKLNFPLNQIEISFFDTLDFEKFELQITKSNGLNSWPAGFFDGHEKVFRELNGLRTQ